MNQIEQLSVWAPRADKVTLAIADRRFPMGRDDADWWHPANLPEDLVAADVDYGFIINDGDVLPDPRSRRQPNGVHQLSRTFDHSSYAWGDELWTGKQLPGGVIYELHVGTFTQEGTLVSAIERLDHLVDLGVDFVEVMPVNGFNGPHGWGYDGVLWYSVHEQYGGPAAYQQFVDACHQRGLAVIQDVVYNHLGPSGNYLPHFGPYLKQGQANVWGDTVNLDGEDSDEVRRYIIDNAMMWLKDYHVDGLRLDAVHALIDTRATHVLEELAVQTEALSTFLNRPLSLIAESDMNDPRMITAREAGGYGLTAQWSDDFHHALYVSLTSDTTGYYADFESLSSLGKVFEAGFFHDGTVSTFRGRSHGNKIDTLRTPTWRLVVCSDNHDQIGNRAAGERLSSKLNHQQLQIAALVTLLSPFTPMIFMGEEWGASTPWQFFTSHPEPELAEKVAKGRLEEFAQMDWDVSAVPNPQDVETFTNSKLNWEEVSEPRHAGLLDFYRRLIVLRRTYPDLTDPRFDKSITSSHDAEGWLLVERGDMVVLVNFRDSATEVSVADGIVSVLDVGDVQIAGNTAKLGAHSALVGQIQP
ncbi:MAG TPA: malto-oligosyltrehalose trehalohydrolase [Propionibacteriaceae bacterium]|nr:malto-oligosyltrehalose trehalohydrolase [Propionibacteriaceae bacterium]